MTTTTATTTAGTHPVARLRAATAGDLPAVERLLTGSHLPLDGVREALSTFVVAEAGTEVVGVAGLEVCRDNALLRSVAVAEGWRSRGLGRELVTRVVSNAQERRIRALYLLTTTADRYFPGFGFTTIERAQVPDDVRATAEFQGACPASATVMRRPLLDA